LLNATDDDICELLEEVAADLGAADLKDIRSQQRRELQEYRRRRQELEKVMAEENYVRALKSLAAEIRLANHDDDSR
jgi:hypothetical protein